MKVDNKTIKVDQELSREIEFNDHAINKLRTKEGKRKDIKFNDIKVSYLKGLRLRYSLLRSIKLYLIFFK